jgi:tripeptidyl-peptidase-1
MLLLNRLAVSFLAIIYPSYTVGEAQPCDTAVGPPCVDNWYDFPPITSSPSGNRIAIAGFQEQYANEADLRLFMEEYDIQQYEPLFLEQELSGGQNSQDPERAGLVANLNIQYTVGFLSGQVPVTFISSGLSNLQGMFYLTESILAEERPPTVLLFTYAWRENTTDPVLAVALCDEFRRLGDRGVSVIVSTGDGGVSGHRFSDACGKFVPTFPASCPYVTAVGGTGNNVNGPTMTEMAAPMSAGGFSNLFLQPWYQVDVVTLYLNQLGSEVDPSRFNGNGRAYPDVSAAAERIFVVQGGQERIVNTT